MALIEQAIARAEEQRARGDLEGAAATLDAVAYQDRPRVLPILQGILGELAVTEHGILFRYVPAGTFRMGSDSGEQRSIAEHRVPARALRRAGDPVNRGRDRERQGAGITSPSSA